MSTSNTNHTSPYRTRASTGRSPLSQSQVANGPTNPNPNPVSPKKIKPYPKKGYKTVYLPGQEPKVTPQDKTTSHLFSKSVPTQATSSGGSVVPEQRAVANGPSSIIRGTNRGYTSDSSSDSEDDQPLVITPEQAAYNEEFYRNQKEQWRKREEEACAAEKAYHSEEAVAQRAAEWERLDMQVDEMHEDVARSIDYDAARWAS